jgi:hypothetical protein
MVLKSRMFVLFPSWVQWPAIAELSAFVVIWTTESLISDEVYWQQCVLPLKKNSRLVSIEETCRTISMMVGPAYERTHITPPVFLNEECASHSQLASTTVIVRSYLHAWRLGLSVRPSAWTELQEHARLFRFFTQPQMQWIRCAVFSSTVDTKIRRNYAFTPPDIFKVWSSIREQR